MEAYHSETSVRFRLHLNTAWCIKLVCRYSTGAVLTNTLTHSLTHSLTRHTHSLDTHNRFTHSLTQHTLTHSTHLLTHSTHTLSRATAVIEAPLQCQAWSGRDLVCVCLELAKDWVCVWASEWVNSRLRNKWLLFLIWGLKLSWLIVLHTAEDCSWPFSVRGLSHEVRLKLDCYFQCIWSVLLTTTAIIGLHLGASKTDDTL